VTRKKYIDWLAEFIKDKKEVPVTITNDGFAVHSTRRFLDSKGEIWEIAITYTGRLVIRKGIVISDGISVVWNDWITEHDVDLLNTFKYTA
jgi:hypothetical protein